LDSDGKVRKEVGKEKVSSPLVGEVAPRSGDGGGVPLDLYCVKIVRLFVDSGRI
jgi:hypothetical protein